MLYIWVLVASFPSSSTFLPLLVTDSFFNAFFFFLHVGVYINAGGVTDALAAFRRLPFLVSSACVTSKFKAEGLAEQH